MPKSLTPVTPVEVVTEPSVREEFSQARTYLQAGRAMAHGAAACMVLLGVELRRIKATFPETRGRKKTDAIGFLTWAGALKAELGIDDDTARKYIALADAAKARLPQVADIARELLDTPLGSLPEMKRAELVERVQCQLPASSAQQLMWDWGIARGRGGKREKAARPASGPETPQDIAAAIFARHFDTVKAAEEILLNDLDWADLPVDLATKIEAKLKALTTRYHERILKLRWSR